MLSTTFEVRVRVRSVMKPNALKKLGTKKAVCQPMVERQEMEVNDENSSPLRILECIFRTETIMHYPKGANFRLIAEYHHAAIGTDVVYSIARIVTPRVNLVVLTI